jgi:hypothetical protein
MPYAAVAANISMVRAMVNVARVAENKNENATTAPILAGKLLMRYRPRIAIPGTRVDIRTLMILAVVVKGSSLHWTRPSSS